MSDCGCQVEINSRQQARVLIILLAINACMFVTEIVLGIISESTALIADSLDMLADATVYAIALYAVYRSAASKVKAAYISGIFQVLLGISVVADVIRRTVFGSEPESLFMIAVGIAALVANIICLQLISRHKDGEIHMRASWIFSKNDVIANVGIIIGGILVHALGTRYPDLIVGLAISALVMRGGLMIIKDANKEMLKGQEAD